MFSPGLADKLHARIRSTIETADRAHLLLAQTRTRLKDRHQLEASPSDSPLRARGAAVRRQSGTGRWMPQRLTTGNEPLERAGLVAFTPCGHWWVYPVHANAAQMHDLARFNLGIACSFCLAEWQAAQQARTPGTTWRVN